MKNKRYFTYISVLILSIFLIFSSTSCTAKKKIVEDDFAVDVADADLSEAGLSDSDLTLDDASSDTETNDFAEFEADSSNNASESQPTDDVANIENELNQISDESANQVTQSQEAPAVAQEVQPEPVVVDTPPPQVIEPEAPPVEVVSEPAIAETPVTEVVENARINNIQYKGNANGGTVVISSNSPLKYTTRVNSSNNQVVVEVENAVVADHLKRPLNTKDMSSSIGHVDIYQKKNSNVARFVIQLRPNSPEPLVQPEGNSLLIIGSSMAGQPNGTTSNVAQNVSEPVSDGPVSDLSFNNELNNELAAQGIMSSDDLEEFLTNNNKFYGKTISIETTDMDVRDILKFISEESGVNMIFDDEVAGKSSLKLRKVPWDQALVLLLKSKKLSFRRQGSILRIAKLETLYKEDEDAIKLKEAKSGVAPLIVKNFSINYADIQSLETKIKEFIAENKQGGVTRGRVTGDTRTNTLIVTETASKLNQIEQLIKALDTQPQQVMIESKIIEAGEKYSRSIGMSLGANRTAPGIAGGQLTEGTNVPAPGVYNGRYVYQKGSKYMSPSINMTPSKGQSGALLGNIFFGTIGALGNLDAQISLDELESKVKVLSSPRVSVLTNTTATINQGATIMQKSAESTTPSAGGSATTTQTYTPVKVGVSLKVTPQISNIGTVRLKLDVSRTIVEDTSSGSTNDRNVTTEIIVRSGDTAVIGGVFTSDVVKSKSGVPGLKDLPILGTLFRGEEETNNKTELMVFVTPKIIPTLGQVFKAESSNGGDVQ